tara:strand:- start:401 stop:922 length:522 start_codon:yes stop_codon:yes gene_type:complete
MLIRITAAIKNVYSNYFEIASFAGAILIIVLAILLDNLLNLRACPLCILTRYVFGLIALISLIDILIPRLDVINKILIAVAAIYGIIISQKLIYLQNLSPEEVAKLSMGCDMPLETQIEYFGLIGGLANVYKGGPTCAEESWRFILNFAEWGLIFFIIYLFSSLFKVKNKLFK